MNPDGFIWVVGAFLLALALLIFIHELGHYSVARLCNVKILRFSIGFGRPLWVRKWGPDQTEWALSAIPLGGYVKMLDEREGEVAVHERNRAFNRQSVGRRSLIVLAGPLANLLLAMMLYWYLFMNGVEEPKPVLDAPPPATLAAAAKIGAGETVRSISGVPVKTWTEMRWEILQRVLDREPLAIETIAPNQHLAFYRIETHTLEPDAIEGDVLQTLGLRLQRPVLPAILGSIQSGSPAERAGLKVGDLVEMLDEHPVASWHEVASGIRAGGGREIRLSLRRNQQTIDVRITPEMIEERGGRTVPRIGIGVKDDPELRRQALITMRYAPTEAMSRALAQTWDTAVLSLRMMGRMLMGEISVKNISGPVTIADYAGQSARMGADHYLRFLALISISLGVLNLLPIPVLDGGHLMYYLAEFIRGAPLSERVMEVGQQVGIVLLALLMAVAFYNDINRLISG